MTYFSAPWFVSKRLVLFVSLAFAVPSSALLFAAAEPASAAPRIVSPTEGSVLDTANLISVRVQDSPGKKMILQICSIIDNQSSVVVGSRCSRADSTSFGPNGNTGALTHLIYQMRENPKSPGNYEFIGDLRPRTGAPLWPYFSRNVYLRAAAVSEETYTAPSIKIDYGDPNLMAPGQYTKPGSPSWISPNLTERQDIWSPQVMTRFAEPSSSTKVVSGVSINGGAVYTNSPKVKVAVELGPFFGAVSFSQSLIVSNDGGFGASKTFDVSPFEVVAASGTTKAVLDWTLQSSGSERLPKTVYVKDSGSDDIILDERPPTVSSASLGSARAAARRFSVRVVATDKNSGVASAQITASKSKPGALLRYRRSITVASSSKPKWVRVQDKAGNFSKWKKIR